MTKKEIETYCPENQEEWRRWLIKNHQLKQSVWLIFYKKTSTNHNLSWSESVDEALCFGWIDSTKRAIDNEKYMQYFSKRKAKSNWSKINKNKIYTLIEKGLMQEAGYKSIETAKQNGSWTLLEEVEALVIPKDLNNQLVAYKNALQYFNDLSKSTKKLLLHWVISARRVETRQNRIFEIADSASQGQLPKQFRSK
tara:strand:+ start:1397 stop:1984 length:588 start_codon:yes stop_codon:yes gene_type:complete